MSAQRKQPQFRNRQPRMGLPFKKELVVDLFAGGGGASTGNSVCPDEAEALVRANASDIIELYRSLAA